MALSAPPCCQTHQELLCCPWVLCHGLHPQSWAGQSSWDTGLAQDTGGDNWKWSSTVPLLPALFSTNQTLADILQRILPLLERRFQGVQSYWWFYSPVTTKSTFPPIFGRLSYLHNFKKWLVGGGFLSFLFPLLNKTSQCLIEDTSLPQKKNLFPHI